MENIPRKIYLSVTFILVLLYIWFACLQYTEFFYEAQFLHIDFIHDLVNGAFNAKHFFTTFGEHLFPGYNVLLYVNYTLFGLTGLFELVCSVLASIVMAYVLCKAATKEKRSSWLPLVIVAIVLSPVQNIMWGMALAAHLSTLLLVLIAYLIYFKPSTPSQWIWISLLVPIYVVFFAGAYAVGFLAVIASVCVLGDIQKDKKTGLVLLGASLISYLAYYYLLEHYGPGLSHSAMGYDFNFTSIAGFADLMLGSSLLGKALFEKYQSLTIYYVAGFYVCCILLLMAGAILFKIKGKLTNQDKFFIALCVYALVNIVIVSIARNTNGPEGALGQWYQAHLKFIPVAIAYFLSSNETQSKGYTIARYLLLSILVTFLSLGYVREYIKGPYVSGWKSNINASIPEHFVHPERFLSSKNSDPLSWDAQAVHDGLKLLYNNNLSHFRHSKAIASTGLNPDGWVEKTDDPFFDVICPSAAKSIIIHFDRINMNNMGFFPKNTHLVNQHEAYQITYYFHNEIKYFRLNVSKFAPYQSENARDLRILLFHVTDLQCV